MLVGIAVSVLAFSVYSHVTGYSFLLGWIALVPWLAALDRLRSLRAALLAGLAMCVVFTVGVFFWFAQAMQGYTGAPLPLTLLVLMLLAPILQPQLLAFAVTRVAMRGASAWCKALAGAGVYVGSERLIPKLLGDTLGHGLLPAPWLRQAADLAGAPGLTFLLILGNDCVLALQRAVTSWPTKRSLPAVLVPGLCLVGLASVPCFYGAIRLRQLDERGPGAELEVAVVQANISDYSRLARRMSTYDAVRMILDRHLSLSTQALADGSLDLLVWPETIYPTTFGFPKSKDGTAFDHEIAGFSARTGVPLLFGSYDAEEGREYNAAMLIVPFRDRRMTIDTYRKMRLFPFTEYVPALVDQPILRRWLPWLGTWTSGGGPSTLPLLRSDGSRVLLAPLICFDAVDPTLAIEAVRDGAEVIVVLSNDAWFSKGGGPRLHLVVSAFRSIETRRPQIRSTTTGISAVISPSGEILDSIAVGEQGVLRAVIHPQQQLSTLMLAWGDWFGSVALLLGGMALATGRWQRWHQRDTSSG